MSRSQTGETRQDTTAPLSKRDRRTVADVVRKKAEETVDEYTTVGELRALTREVVRSEAVRVEIAAPYETKKRVAAQALAEELREEITQHL